MTLPPAGSDPSVGDLVKAGAFGALNDAASITASGSVTFTPTAGVWTTATVTFPASRFSSAPNVQVSVLVAGTGSISTWGLNAAPTATGCVIGVLRSNAVATTLYWSASLTP